MFESYKNSIGILILFLYVFNILISRTYRLTRFEYKPILSERIEQTLFL